MGTSGEYGERIQRAVRAQIRAEIAARGLKQNDVAKRAGMHASTLSRYLSDDEDRGFPFWALGAIADALDLPPHAIAMRAERRLQEDGLWDEDGDAEGGAAVAAPPSNGVL